MDGNEYLKYVTERVVSYMDRPAERTEEARQDQPRKKLSREPWLTRWFGVAPMGLMMWWNSRSDKKNKSRSEVSSVNSTPYR